VHSISLSSDLVGDHRITTTRHNGAAGTRRWASMTLPLWLDPIRSRCRRSEAQTMAEYAVILGVITPGVVLAFSLFADEIVTAIDRVRSFLS
jgi:Flp pilus assembly pilin Flp